MRYVVTKEYEGLRVCIPGEVIDLVPGVSQAKLRKLALMKYPGVVQALEESPEGQAGDRQGEGGQ